MFTGMGAFALRGLPTRIGGILILCLTLWNGEAFAQATPPPQQPSAQTTGQRDLSQVSLEDLMNIQVTSVSKKDQKLSEAAAAIFVITQEDIRRSGATTLRDDAPNASMACSPKLGRSIPSPSTP